MSKLVFDEEGQRYWSTGINECVLYAGAGINAGTAWDGIISVNEAPSGGDANDLYADNIKYGEIRGAESFGAGIECYMYPVDFDMCVGAVEGGYTNPGGTRMYARIGQQNRAPFSIAYKTKASNGNDNLVQVHILYGLTVKPTSKAHDTVNENPNAATISLDAQSVPFKARKAIDGKILRPYSHISFYYYPGIDEDGVDDYGRKYLGDVNAKKILDYMYGTDPTEDTDGYVPMLPDIETIEELLTPTPDEGL